MNEVVVKTVLFERWLPVRMMQSTQLECYDGGKKDMYATTVTKGDLKHSFDIIELDEVLGIQSSVVQAVATG